MTDAPPLVEVRIVGMPIDVYRAASEHTDELLRELALIRDGEEEGVSATVPARLLTLVDELTSRFSGFTVGQDAELQVALARGDSALDLVYHVPADVRQGAVELDRMLDEADEFCRRGDTLLTLATPPRAATFRRWFLGEFVRQIDGRPPTPWHEYAGE